MKNVCIIPAKGCSQRIVRKPMAPLGGRPLLDWTLEFAGQAANLDAIYVLSEDEEILSHSQEVLPSARAWKIPMDMVHPDSPPRDTIIAMLEEVNDGYDNIVLLESPKPFRTNVEYDACLAAVESGSFDSCVTVEHVPHWLFHGPLNEDFSYEPQWELVNTPLVHQVKKQYVCVATVAVVNLPLFFETKKWLAGRTAGIPISRSLAVDIDEYADLEDAQRMLEGFGHA